MKTYTHNPAAVNTGRAAETSSRSANVHKLEIKLHIPFATSFPHLIMELHFLTLSPLPHVDCDACSWMFRVFPVYVHPPLNPDSMLPGCVVPGLRSAALFRRHMCLPYFLVVL